MRTGRRGATPVAAALTDWAQLDEYLATVFPDPAAPGRLDAGETAVQRFGASRYIIGGIMMTLFERLYCIRGMLNVFEDFYLHEAEVRRLISAIADYTMVLIRRWARIGVDAVVMTDDWGSQTTLLISPQMWRKLFKPHYAAMFAEAHRLGMDVLFHTDGNVISIVGDLLEIGLDVLDPLQPGAMDYEQVAKTYGGRLSFSSGPGPATPAQPRVLRPSARDCSAVEVNAGEALRRWLPCQPQQHHRTGRAVRQP